MTARQAQAAIKQLREVATIADGLPKGQSIRAKNKISKVIVLINKQVKRPKTTKFLPL